MSDANLMFCLLENKMKFALYENNILFCY